MATTRTTSHVEPGQIVTLITGEPAVVVAVDGPRVRVRVITAGEADQLRIVAALDHEHSNT